MVRADTAGGQQGPGEQTHLLVDMCDGDGELQPVQQAVAVIVMHLEVM